MGQSQSFVIRNLKNHFIAIPVVDFQFNFSRKLNSYTFCTKDLTDLNATQDFKI